MAIQGKSVTAAEHDWFATRSGLGNVPMNDHKREYFSTKGFRSNASLSRPLSQLEREWLQNVGSSTSNEDYELWVNACQAQSVPVGRSVNECKFNFFTGVAAGTNP